MSKLDQIRALYRSAKYYRDHGTQTVLTSSSFGNPSVTSTVTFQTSMNGKGQFNFRYTKLDQNGDLLRRGIIMKEEGKDKVYSKFEYGKLDLNQELSVSFKEAIAMHTGVSNHISYIVPSLIYDKELGATLFYEGLEVTETESQIKGQACVQLSVKNEIALKPLDKASSKGSDIPSFKPYPRPSFKPTEGGHKLNEQFIFEKQKERLHQPSQSVSRIQDNSRYYFRMRDLLLIKQEKTLQTEYGKYEYETHYNAPQLF